MAERTVFTLSEEAVTDLVRALQVTCGDVQVMVEHWPSERTTVAVKGPRTWGPPIEIESYFREDDFPLRPEHEAEIERHKYAAGKNCDGKDWPETAA